MRAPAAIEESVRYELLRPLAQGGMGHVFEAVQEGPDAFRKRVAIKMIREEYSRLRAFRRNFLGEARLVADLIHTNIVQIYHLGVTGKHYFMVMELVEGVNLEEFLLQHRALGRPVPADLAAFILSRVARALSYAHRYCGRDGAPLNIVHRDVCPRNILLSLAGDVKLTDFGIAKALNLMYSEEGEVIAGRSEYLSPEQSRREVTDGRADLFSCGVVLLEMLLGYNPFQGETAEASRGRIETMAVPDLRRLQPGLDPALVDVLNGCLRKKREERYQTAEALLLAIEHVIYDRAYGPTHEKLGTYLAELYRDGVAYEEDELTPLVSHAANGST